MAILVKDTHKLITILNNSGFSARQAEGMKAALDLIDISDLATKHDLQDLRTEMYKVAATQVIVILGAMVALANAF